MNDQPESALTIAAKLSPPAAVTAAPLLNMSVAEWIQWLTLFYLILMIAHKLWVYSLEFQDFWFKRKEGGKKK